mgnify:CR=1 FL=1
MYIMKAVSWYCITTCYLLYFSRKKYIINSIGGGSVGYGVGLARLRCLIGVG